MKSIRCSGWFTVGLGVTLSSNGCALRDVAGDTSGVGGSTSRPNQLGTGASAMGAGGGSLASGATGGTGGLGGAVVMATAGSPASTSALSQWASAGALSVAGGALATGGTTASVTATSGTSPSYGGVSTGTNGGSQSAGAATALSGVEAAGGIIVAASGASAGGSQPHGGSDGATTAGTGTSSVTAGAGTSNCFKVSEFINWTSGKAPLDIGKLAVNNFRSHTGDDYGSAGYAWTFAYFGSLQFTKLTDDSPTNTKLIADFEPYASGATASPDNSATATVDDRAFGDLPLEIFLENGDARCRQLGLDRADGQWSKTNSEGVTSDARYWIDDMYMITALQVFAYRATQDPKYLDRAARTMQAYVTALQQADGLFWHTKQAKVYWGRANGWVASGMTELLLELPSGFARDSIMAAYRTQMDALVSLQITSGNDAGCWRQVLDLSTASAESSGTAMFTFALVTGVKNGWLTDAKYVSAARAGWEALGRKTNASGILDKVCPGTGQAPAGDLASQQLFYASIALGSNDQHGQAPLMWAATALLRTDCRGLR